jgi:hypothetical protein
MKLMIAAAVIASQLATAAPAAELGGDAQASAQRRGAFAGARFRLPLGGRDAGKARLALALTPAVQSQGRDGALVTRYGQGLELGLAGRDRARLSFAGTPVSRLAGGGEGPGGRRLGVSTAGWVAIGVGILAASAAAVYVLCGTGTICNTDDD